MKRIIWLAAVILLTFSGTSYAGDLSLGLGYPYISAKYDFRVLSVEGRFVTDSGIRVYSGRFYWDYYTRDKLKGFAGLEGGYTNFNVLDTKGTGYETALFVGGEYLVAQRLSLLLDFAPTYIALKHADDSGVKVNGFEFVANIGLYYHFGAYK